MPLQILIVDDHVLARSAIRLAMQFCKRAEIEIVGEAVDGTSAIELAKQLDPDVVTMDIGLPDVNGLEVTRTLHAEMPQINVVVVTMHGEREYREAAVKAGAVFFVNKMYLMDELPDCLDRLAGQCSVPSLEHGQ